MNISTKQYNRNDHHNSAPMDQGFKDNTTEKYNLNSTWTLGYEYNWTVYIITDLIIHV